MDKQVNITTTGTQSTFTIDDLGARLVTHPMSNLNLLLEYTISELVNSADLQSAIDLGYITAYDENNISIIDLKDSLISDMSKLIYDNSGTIGIIDNAESLEGNDSAYHLDRANHTGTQPATTISDIQTTITNNTEVLANTAKISNATHTGDVTGDTILTIAANVVTNTKAAQMAANTVKLNATGALANQSDLPMATNTMLARLNSGNIVAANPTEITAILNTFTPTLNGLVPLSGGGTSNFLRADGTWSTFTSNRVIYVQETGGDFNSVVDALASITDNDINNRYVINVSGIFTETLIDLSTKPYVSLTGDTINTTVIKPSTSTQHVIKIGEMNEISFLTIQGAGANYAGVYCNDGGNFSQLHKVSIYDCDICVLIENTIVDSQVYLEYVDFAGTYSYGIKVINSGAGLLFVNAENQYSFNEAGLITTYHVEGANALLEILASGNETTVATANGVVVHSGATVNVISAYFTGYDKAFYMPNIGATPILTCSNIKLDNNNNISCDIAHVSGSGNFQGTTETNPIFNIVSTATFGIQYLERLNGNKRQIYIDNASSNLVAFTNPTTTAAIRSYYGNTGFVVTALKGTNSSNNGFSVNFKIPEDYQSSGSIKLLWTSQSTNTDNVKINFILSLKNIDDSLGVITESGLSLVFPSTSGAILKETAKIPITSTFLKNQIVSLRVYRLGSDVDDVYTGYFYIQGVVFEYESNK